MKPTSLTIAATAGLLAVCAAPAAAQEQKNEIVTVGGEGHHCGEDPGCINRLHPAIEMVAKVKPGQTILLHARNASDQILDPSSDYDDLREPGDEIGPVHPLAGPVHIDGAEPGDVLAVTIHDIDPGDWGYTSASDFGFASDLMGEDHRILWKLSRRYAESDDLPGIRIPNGAFPGVITTLPGEAALATMLAREAALAEAGGTVFQPDPTYAYPQAVCGEGGSHTAECLRTIPPREHGGNMDIRYMGVGATIYLPCMIEGCGLAIGDFHYAQGDGEVAGTAIEMDATGTGTTQVLSGANAPELAKGPHFEGPARLLDIPSRRFYAVTGYPLKDRGSVPPTMGYLDSPTLPGLENLNKNINVAARNALDAAVSHIQAEYGYSREEAYMIASVAVDLRIGQLVDTPNVNVAALIPLDIFVGEEAH